MLRQKHGFTLIELSIVLVIIGLIIGGIVTGQSLIHSSNINNFISQKQQTDLAVNAFKLRYNSLPGDMHVSKTALFGLFTFTGVKAGGYGYGDGNGQVNDRVYVPSAFDDGAGEALVFWRHLTEAELIPGSYGMNAANPLNTSNGSVTSNVTNEADVGLYIPKTKLYGTHMAVDDNTFEYTTYNIGNVLSIDTTLYITGSSPDLGGVTQTDAFLIDTKLDDALPDTGIVFSDGSFGGYTCTTGASAYNTAGASARICYMAIKM